MPTISAELLSAYARPGIAAETGGSAPEKTEARDLTKTASEDRSGDRVTISEEGRRRALALERPTPLEAREEEKEQRIRTIQERIEKLKEEIARVQRSDIEEKEKQKRILALTQELLELSSELGRLRGGGKGATPFRGGTEAMGMSDSLT
jgi:TolA-binding protein